MSWLQQRLNELHLTHQDLQKRLARLGIVRVRETITGWAGGNAVSILSDPRKAAKLAQALNWTVSDMMLAAGYDIIEIPPELEAYITEYRDLTPKQKQVFMETLEFASNFWKRIQDEEIVDMDEKARM